MREWMNASTLLKNKKKKKRGHMYTCVWFMLLSDRGQYNVVEQLSSQQQQQQQKKKVKKENYIYLPNSLAWHSDWF